MEYQAININKSKYSKQESIKLYIKKSSYILELSLLRERFDDWLLELVLVYWETGDEELGDGNKCSSNTRH